MTKSYTNDVLHAKLQASYDKAAHSLVRILRIKFERFVAACDWLNTPNKFLHGKTPAKFVMKGDYATAISALNAA